MNIMEHYQKDKNFREYVDRFCKTYNKTVKEALNLSLVQEVAKYYLGIETEENSKVQTGKSTYVPLGECM